MGGCGGCDHDSVNPYIQQGGWRFSKVSSKLLREPGGTPKVCVGYRQSVNKLVRLKGTRMKSSDSARADDPYMHRYICHPSSADGNVPSSIGGQ